LKFLFCLLRSFCSSFAPSAVWITLPIPRFIRSPQCFSSDYFFPRFFFSSSAMVSCRFVYFLPTPAPPSQEANVRALRLTTPLVPGKAQFFRPFPLSADPKCCPPQPDILASHFLVFFPREYDLRPRGPLDRGVAFGGPRLGCCFFLFFFEIFFPLAFRSPNGCLSDPLVGPFLASLQGSRAPLFRNRFGPCSGPTTQVSSEAWILYAFQLRSAQPPDPTARLPLSSDPRSLSVPGSLLGFGLVFALTPSLFLPPAETAPLCHSLFSFFATPAYFHCLFRVPNLGPAALRLVRRRRFARSLSMPFFPPVASFFCSFSRRSILKTV